MPDFYIDSNATAGTEDGLSWANAFLTTPAYVANVGTGVGDEVWYASDHHETQSTMFYCIYYDNSKIISVNKSTDVAEVGALIDTDTGAILQIQVSNTDGGFVYIEGMHFAADNDIIFSTTGVKIVLKNSKIELSSTSTNDIIDLTTAGLFLHLIDSTIKMNRFAQEVTISFGAMLVLDNVTIEDVVGQICIFDIGGTGGATLIVKNSDISSINTAVLVEQSTDTDDIVHVEFDRVKVGSYTLFSDTIRTNRFFSFYSTDTADGYYKQIRSYREGDILTSTTVYRTLGATYDGSTGFSAEVQTNSNVIPYSQPLKYKLAEIEIDLTTSKTLTAHIIQQDGSFFPANLTDHECWIEVNYPDATDNALGKTVSSQTTGILETPVDLSLSNQAWTGTSGNVTKQLMSAVVPASIAKAPVTVHLCVAKDITVADGNGASTIEMFACPKLEIS